MEGGGGSLAVVGEMEGGGGRFWKRKKGFFNFCNLYPKVFFLSVLTPIEHIVIRFDIFLLLLWKMCNYI